MSGTKAGGQKAALTNKEKYGKEFYSEIGRKGGQKSNNGGFASNKVGADGLTGSERAKIAGSKGGKISKRGPAKPKTQVKKPVAVKPKTAEDKLIEDLREYEKHMNEPVKVEKKGFFSRWFGR